MRLLHVDTLELEEFNESAIPKYAILSHTWGKEEVTLQDLQHHYRERSLLALGRQLEPDYQRSKPVYEQAGFSKISKFAQWARNLGYRYIWIDTCCINKTSSAELSEAINSMFRWYKYADLCGAYMSDVFGTLEDQTGMVEFKRSRWFTRGWTLQELLCPADLVFLNASWTPIGTKNSIPADKRFLRERLACQSIDRLPTTCSTIASITGIDEQCLKSLDCLDSFDIATRMYWSSKRETTKKEDAAYCLMGILGIKMPLLYGEEEQALIRLQEEVMNRNEDISSLAWGVGMRSCALASRNDGLLASSLLSFSKINSILLTDFALASTRIRNCWERALQDGGGPPAEFTNRGLHITLPIIDAGPHVKYAIIRRELGGRVQLIILPLIHESGYVYSRSLSANPWCLSHLPEQDVTIQTKTIYIRRRPRPIDISRCNKLLRYPQLARYGYVLIDSFPPTSFLSPTEQDTAVIDDSIPGEVLLRFKVPGTGDSLPRIILLSISFEHQKVALVESEDDGGSILDVLAQKRHGRNAKFSTSVNVPGIGTLHASFVAEASDGRAEVILQFDVPETGKYATKIDDRFAVHQPWVEVRDSSAAKGLVLVIWLIIYLYYLR